MSLATSVEITGLKQAMTELSKLDKSARFRAAAKIKASSPAMMAEARRQFPSEIGVSMIHGMGNWGRLGYIIKAVDEVIADANRALQTRLAA